MKKALCIGILFGTFALTSCKKEYTCDYPVGPANSYSSKDFSKSQLDAAKLMCDKAGGNWSSK